MSRLIDADDLKNVFEGYSCTENPNPHFPLDMVKMDIDKAPTVEAIPVKAICDALLENIKIVHCKDCSHWGTGLIAETEHVKCCEFAKWMVGENGYCVYGELRTSAE